MCDRQQRDSVTLYITSLLYPDTHSSEGGGAVQLAADRKQACSSPLSTSPSHPTCLYSLLSLHCVKLPPRSLYFLNPGSHLLACDIATASSDRLSFQKGHAESSRDDSRLEVSSPPSTQNVHMRRLYSKLIQPAFDLLIEDCHWLIPCVYCEQSASLHITAKV